MQDIYTVMNKNVPVADFVWEEEEHDAVLVKFYKELPWFIYDLNTWLESRSFPKHRAHMEVLMDAMGITSTKAAIDYSKGLTLTDTLWVNRNMQYNWEDINLYDHEFDEVIEHIAFDGGMYGMNFTTTSPEIGTNGMYPKCWHRESDGQIYLYKQGSSGAYNAGLEVYSEMYASQIANALGFNHVTYDVIKYRGKLVSRCPLFTSKSQMLLPIAAGLKGNAFINVIKYMRSHKLMDRLGEQLVLDAIILNEDRHYGNFGLLCDANTYEVLDMAPIYDNGNSLLYGFRPHPKYPDPQQDDPYAYADSRTPASYAGHIKTATMYAPRDVLASVNNLIGFHFDTSGPYNLEPERIRMLEDIVQRQVHKLLSTPKQTNLFD